MQINVLKKTLCIVVLKVTYFEVLSDTTFRKRKDNHYTMTENIPQRGKLQSTNTTNIIIMTVNVPRDI